LLTVYQALKTDGGLETRVGSKQKRMAQHYDASLASFPPRDNSRTFRSFGPEVDKLTLNLCDFGNMRRYLLIGYLNYLNSLFIFVTVLNLLLF